MQSHRSRPRTGRHALACAIAALALLHETRPALAATVEWVGGSGSWSDAAHWSGSFVPPAGFAAVLGVQSAPTPSVTVNFNYAYDQSAGLTQLVINSTGIPGVFTLLQTGLGTTMVASSEIIGDTISGNVYDQRAGDNFTTTLVLGNRSGGDGRYLLSGTGNLHVDTLQVGLAGSGAFSQDGVNSSVFAKQVGIGFGNGAASNYTLAGGSLNIANGGTLAIQPARGSFTQTGGSVSFSGTSGLFISTTAAAAGPAYTLSGGAIVGAAYETIGFNIASGTATFAQLAGSNTLAAGGVLTEGDNSAGMYRMAGGTLSTQTLALGNQGGGNGVFAQTGGNVTLTAGGELDIGKAAASSGLYTIDNQPVTNGSTLQASVIKVGVAGNGSFRQSNGSVSTTTLTLADATGSTGSYTLNGGALQVGSASAAGTLFVGLSGGGTFTQTGGAVTVIGGNGNEGQVQIGRSASASSTYFLKGGNLNADSVLVGALGGEIGRASCRERV